MNELLDTKKARPHIAGVYRAYDPQTGETLVGYSYHIYGTFNRYKLELAMNACTIQALQRLWNKTNGSMQLEILEEYPGDAVNEFPEEMEEALQKMAKKHVEALGEKARLLQMA